MNVNINFYGHSIELDPQEVIDAEGLDATSTKGEIRRAVLSQIEEALHNDEFPEYDSDGEDVEEEIRSILQGLDNEDDDA